jgi:chromosome segregation ATPase
MDFNEILEKYKEQSNPDKLMTALNELEKTSNDASHEARQAATAYYADADKKAEKIGERISELSSQHDSLQAEIDALKKEMVSAVGSAEYAKLSGEMKQLTISVTVLNDELDTLTNTHVRGNKVLYDNAIEKNMLHYEARKAYSQAKSQLWEFSKDTIDRLQEIARQTVHSDVGGGSGINLEKIEEHYHHDKRQK